MRTVPQPQAAKEMFNFNYEQQYNGHPIKSPEQEINALKSMFTMKY